ncbi:putative phosphoglycerate kinase [Leptomonas pyrrhocoris]|uniref:Phosphoglycerate kinase n=1 Tax=Leptomonas pyrrhocoris TaxID=157538 RepID=A0A0M9G2Q5_LEPPY|nr:putative phosphoglycerate kinase [Leptomonas pyrrhocoris]KPA81033.1 putative phosphoglycerate kinase [Leptomonas pyrrhocoris]|eukprot:XP_015659472.1 putative phosphoglycerate kinase [Leptomonas pyrrhocoris]
MPLGYLGSKHTVYDIYPIRNKRALLLVDPQNILHDSADLHATIGTISYLLKKHAIVVVAASFGPLPGITLNLSRKEREAALEAFRREDGLGYTNFFSSLTPAEKVKLLSRVPGLDFTPSPASAPGYHQAPNTGKTSLFGTLSNEQKSAVLRAAYPNQDFVSCTTFPFVAALQQHFPGVQVTFAPDCMRPPTIQMQPGTIVVLENYRFYRNEIATVAEERIAMAEVLAAEIDVFINDSFGTSHRTLASNVELPKLQLHGAAGLSMERELAFYSKFLSHPSHPLAVMVGGSDIVRKMRLIRNLAERVDRILIAGAVAFPFLVARGAQAGRGYETGEKELRISVVTTPLNNSLAGRECLPTTRTCSQYAAEILQICEENNVDVVLPIDHLAVADPDIRPYDDTEGKEKAKIVEVPSPSVPPDMYSVDCGVETVNLFMRSLRGCRTLFWTGMIGWYGKGFCKGTESFATRLASTDIIAMLAGQHTALTALDLGIADKVFHVSGGGLASLEFLMGGSLPGIESLTDVAPPVDPKMYISVNELLRSLPLFAGCNSHQLRTVARKFVRRVHGEGDFLFHRGDRHTCMYLVARGGLVAHYGEDYSSTPSRYVGKGQTVGMYEFITQAQSMETVRAALPDTVTYHLSFFVLNDLLNGYPDLAIQLFQNISEPLRQIVNVDYYNQQTPTQVAWRNSCRTRVPLPCTIPRNTALWEDVVQDVIIAVALQKLTMRFTPYVPKTPNIEPEALVGTPSVLYGGLLQRLQYHQYLPCNIAVAVLRNFLYHYIVSWMHSPAVAAVVSAMAVSPLRVWSYGIMYCDINFKMVLEEAVCGAVVSVAPATAYKYMLSLQDRYERRRQRPMGRVTQLALMAVVKALLGVIIFPVIYQRNFIYTQPTASRFWKTDAFKAYEVKQVLSVLLRCSVHNCLKVLSLA